MNCPYCDEEVKDTRIEPIFPAVYKCTCGATFDFLTGEWEGLGDV